jgi:two-component system CheB/CheR fusion protein
LKPKTGKIEIDALYAAQNPLSNIPIHFPVVGIGASAGGLNSFNKLLPAIPPNPGMTWIPVLHLDPTNESMLAYLLQNGTPLPVNIKTKLKK